MSGLRRLPGVTVTVRSPSLQGTRAAITDINGNYSLPQLPPGDYSVVFEISGFGDNTTIRPDADGPRDALGIPTTYVEGDRFGEATSAGDYRSARSFLIAWGFRF